MTVLLHASLLYTHEQAWTFVSLNASSSAKLPWRLHVTTTRDWRPPEPEWFSELNAAVRAHHIMVEWLDPHGDRRAAAILQRLRNERFATTA